MLRHPKPGNPVMEQMGGGGFQITPEELAFKAQGDPGRAKRSGIFQGIVGGPMRGMSAYRTSMEQSKAEQTQKMLRGAYERLIGTEGRTRQDLNEMALFRAQITGEQPRLYAPPNIQTTLRERPYTKGGVGYFQREFVGIDPDTGQMVGEAQPYGDPIRQRPRKSRAPLTYEQEAQYKNKLDTRAMISMGGWDDQILDIIKAIDPEQSLDVNDPQAAMKALLGGKGSDKLPNYVLDYLNELTSAYDAVAGDEAYGDPSQRRKAKIALSERVFDIWRQHKYGDPEQGVTTGTATTGDEFDARLKGLGAPAPTTAAESAQGRSLYDRAQEIVSYASRPSTSRPGSRALRDEQAPERLQPITSPSVSGVPFEGGRQIGTTLEQMAEESRAAVEEHQARRRTGSLERYRRSVKKFKRGDKDRRVLSPLERSLAEIVNGESAVR
jgi:hypothetical protein